MYIHPDANDANACDVYVAYLHSNKSHPMRLQGYSYIDPLMQAHTSLLSFDEGEYVRARLVRKPYLWSQECLLASFDPPKPIDGNAPAQLLETIRRAHQQACDLDGIQPASVSLPGLELNCN